MYYLQSRYYDPSYKRFINADDPTLISDLAQLSTLGGNLFAYCVNNAVMGYDPYGYDAIWQQDKNAVGYLGHSGLLLQDKDRNWYYFYWGLDKVQCMLLKNYSFIDRSQLNKYLANNKIYGTQNDGFEEIRYFNGNYTVSLSYAKAYLSDYLKFYRDKKTGKNKHYSVWSRNCCQISALIMSYTRGKYQSKFNSIKGIRFPNYMFSIIKGW